MPDPLPSLPVPGLNCSARLYAARIPALRRLSTPERPRAVNRAHAAGMEA